MLKVTLANGTVIEASTIEELTAIQSILVSSVPSVPSKPARTTAKAAREAAEKAKRDEYKKTHRIKYTAQENRQRVYAAMGYKKGDNFDRKLYEATADKLGCLAKKPDRYGNRHILPTWEEIK